MSFALDVCRGLNQCGIETTGPRPEVTPRAEYTAHIDGERAYHMTLDNRTREAVIVARDVPDEDSGLFVKATGVAPFMLVRVIVNHARSVYE